MPRKKTTTKLGKDRKSTRVKVAKPPKLRVKVVDSVKVVETVRPEIISKDATFAPGTKAPSSGTYVAVDNNGDAMGNEIFVVKDTKLPPVRESGQKYVASKKSRIEMIGKYFLKNPDKARHFVKIQKSKIRKNSSSK